MDIQCLICHEPTRVPVRFICFLCPHPRGKQACNDTIRVCLLCARSYLELNRPKHQRAEQRKCLMCPTTANPRLLNAERAYAKDYLLMSKDSATYPCIYSDQGCAFSGLQNDLDRHQQVECDFRLMFCPENNCKIAILAKDLEHHRRTDCPNYRKCPSCDEIKHIQQLGDHLLTAHQFKICGHCNVYEHMSRIEWHEKSCPMRPMNCKICREGIHLGEYRTHLENHRGVYINSIRQSQTAIQRLAREIDNQSKCAIQFQENLSQISSEIEKLH